MKIEKKSKRLAYALIILGHLFRSGLLAGIGVFVLSKKRKILLAFALFAVFALIDTNVHAFIGLYVTGLIIGGLGIWLRNWRVPKEIYSRLKRALATIGFLTMVTGIFWMTHGLDSIAFGFMVSVLITLFSMFLHVKRRYHIVELEDLTKQQEVHNARALNTYNFFPFNLLIDYWLRNPKYASARNRLAVENFKRNIDKGKAQVIIERMWPLAGLLIVILLAVGVLK